MKFLDRDDKVEMESSQGVLDKLVRDEEKTEPEKEVDVTEEEGEITLDSYFRAIYPLIWVRTEEDHRALELIRTNLKRLKTTSSRIIWAEFKQTSGLLRSETPGTLEVGNERITTSPVEALDIITDITNADDNPCILIMHNINSAMKVPQFVQALKDSAYHARVVGCYIILLGAQLDIPLELRSMVTVYDLPLPNKEFFKRLFSQLVGKYESMMEEKASETLVDEISQAAVGMTALQGENSAALSIAMRKKLDPEIIQIEKEQAIKQTEVLEFVHKRETIDEVGGWYIYKDWIADRKIALTKGAGEYGLKFPKGVLVAGIPGCGKSLMARATSTFLRVPLLKFDLGKAFQSLVGASEKAIRRMAKTAEAVAPVVLWIEEIEKSAAGSESSGSTDSGTTARVMATLLTWMQETTKPIFFYATCNNVETMPAELYRRGRFTEVWGVSEPSDEERMDIWQVKLQDVRPDTYEDGYDYEQLVECSSMYTGAEIEVGVENAMFRAYADNAREFNTEDLVAAMSVMIPQHITSKKTIDRTRDWMKEKVRMVSSASLLTAEQATVNEGWDTLKQRTIKED